MSTKPTLETYVKSITHEAEGIVSVELRPVILADLPAFEAGAHIDLHLTPALSRSYSLSNPQHERHRYVVTVAKDECSRGGSRLIHETLRVGHKLAISDPRNNFRLAEDAAHSVFIAGGIGITPMLSMIHRLTALGRSWELHYASRTARQAAFIENFAAAANCHLCFTREEGGRRLDLAAIIRSAGGQAHFYCCGPVSMLEAFRGATASLPSENVHFEYFSGIEPPVASEGYTVELAQSKRSVVIPPGKTILDVLIALGMDVGHSCMEGVCGACETKVLEGRPDHHDLVLSEAERNSNATMMICCSGSATERLVLDL